MDTQTFENALAASAPEPPEIGSPWRPSGFETVTTLPGTDGRFTVLFVAGGYTGYTPSPATSEQIADLREGRATAPELGLIVLRMPDVHFRQAFVPADDPKDA